MLDLGGLIVFIDAEEANIEVEARVLDEPVASDHRGMMAVLRRKNSTK